MESFTPLRIRYDRQGTWGVPSRSEVMEQRTLVERLARHLAAGNPDLWQDRVEDAASLLAIMKSPDDAMRQAGDERIWQEMIDAALRERWAIAPASASGEAPGGADEEGDLALAPQDISDNREQWVHLHQSREKQ